jgi:3-oxoacyl-[acyl-carrier protein] reductase
MTHVHDDATRVFLVTGAAGGIGAAIANTLARPSCRLMLHTRANADGLERTADLARECGAEVETTLCDLAVGEHAGELVSKTIARFGALDGVVHNAGFADRTPYNDVRPTQSHGAFDTMAGALLALIQSAREPLSRSAAGRIVAISSFVAHRHHLGGDAFPASAAAKAALEAIVRAGAVELAGTGVTVNAVAPGYIRKDAEKAMSADELMTRRTGSGRIPLGRIGLPEDIAPAVEFLLSPGAGYVTGHTLHVDGGLML